jgi:predicted ATPase
MNTNMINITLINENSFLCTTNWCVITGAPCSGKTSVLRKLEEKGFKCHPEIARVYIEQEISKGRTLEEIRTDEGEFQKGLINTKLNLEKNTDPNNIVFFDRAMPDSITYYRVGELNPELVFPDCFNYKYKKIFVFDRLDYVFDGARTEDELTASFLDKWLEEDYKSLGYDIIRVPVMTVDDRVDFILNRI